MAILEQCEKFFGTRDVYKLFELEKAAAPKDVKKAYYKLSLLVHPDRVSEQEKAKATEKFKVLSKLYQVLSDKEKRTLYDEQGVIDDEDDMETKLNSWLDIWRKIFKPLTEEDISNYEKSYTDSDLERTDMKKAYLSGKGCINHMMNEVPFLRVEDEPRLKRIIGEMINSNEVPEYTAFTKEPAQKRNRRHKKYARESKEADEIKAMLKGRSKADPNGESLEQQLMERQKSREDNYNSLMDKLLQKYGGAEDDSEAVDLKELKKKTKKAVQKKAPKPTAVKTGRVSKRNK